MYERFQQMSLPFLLLKIFHDFFTSHCLSKVDLASLNSLYLCLANIFKVPQTLCSPALLQMLSPFFSINFSSQLLANHSHTKFSFWYPFLLVGMLLNFLSGASTDYVWDPGHCANTSLRAPSHYAVIYLS